MWYVSRCVVVAMAIFALGLQRSKFENHEVTFEEHCQQEHNMWNYLYFVVHLRRKQKTELTGPESYVYGQIKDHIDNKVLL